MLQVLSILEEEEDINQVTEYFSYEHFYVIYCKFWELDKDHDLFIDRADLARHNDHGVSFDSCDLQLNYREWCLNKLSAIYPDVCIYRYMFVCGLWICGGGGGDWGEENHVE